MRGVPARWGDPARGIPTLLDPVQAEEHHEPGSLPPFEPGTPPPSRPGPQPLHLFGKGQGARGPGSRGGPGSGVFSNCGRFGRGNATSRVPPTSRDPLPLLSSGNLGGLLASEGGSCHRSGPEKGSLRKGSFHWRNL